MFRESRQLPKTLCAASALALVLGAGMVGDYVDFDMSIVSSAHAAQPAGGRGEKGAGPSGDVRGGGVKKGGSEGGRGGKSMKDVLAEEDDDSDRPDWAMGNKEPGEPPPPDEGSDRPDWVGGHKELNPHTGDGSATAGTKKGDLFGDLWVILRDEDGNPIYTVYTDTNEDGVIGAGDTYTLSTTCPSGAECFVQPIVDINGVPTAVHYVWSEADAAFALPAEYATLVQEIDVGRTNVARSPTKVMDKSLVEALSKLDGLTYTDTMTDVAGRLVVDGSAIDSPLENLALYKALLLATDLDNDKLLEVTVAYSGESGSGTYTFEVPADEQLDLAASLLAAASDKTNVLTADYVMAVSSFLGVADELVSLVDTYSYDRDTAYADATVDYSFYVDTNNDGVGDQLVTGNDVEVLSLATNPDTAALFSWNPMPATTTDKIDDTPDDPTKLDGITDFAQAADDALQVLEFVHAYAPTVVVP